MIQVLANEYAGTHSEPIPLGQQGENLVRTIVFDISDLRSSLGDGTWTIVARRSGEGTPYICERTWQSQEGYACWDVTEIDTGIAGNGYVELMYFPSDTIENDVCKTIVWVTYTNWSLDAVGDAPSAYDGFLKILTETAGQIQRDAEIATRTLEETKRINDEAVLNLAKINQMIPDLENAGKDITQIKTDLSALGGRVSDIESNPLMRPESQQAVGWIFNADGFVPSGKVWTSTEGGAIWADSQPKTYVTPEMFGAVGNGADDSEAFQRMIDACEYGAKIIIPLGSYYVKNIRIKNQISMTGIGYRSRIFLHQSAVDGDSVFILDGSSTGYELFENFVIDGNADNVSGVCHGISAPKGGAYNKWSGTFRGLIVRNCTGDGIHAECDMMEYTITSCKFMECKNGAWFASFMDSRISDCTFSGCKEIGLRIKGSTVKMVNSKCFMNGTKDSGCGLYLQGIHHSVANVEIQENYYDGVVLDDTSKSYIQLVTNCNNHRDAVGVGQLRVKNSYENKIISVVSGGYMGRNTVPIVEKNGVIEEGICFKNNYDIQFCTSKNHDDNDANIMNVFIAPYNGAVSSKYFVNGDSWFDEDVINVDMSTVKTAVTYCDNGLTIVNNNRSATMTGTCNRTNTYAIIMRGLEFSDAINGDLSQVETGDIVQISAYVKNNVSARVYLEIQLNLNGSYKKLTALREERSKAGNYDMITGYYVVPNGYSEKTSAYKFVASFVLGSLGVAMPIGTALSVSVKDLRAKISHV